MNQSSSSQGPPSFRERLLALRYVPRFLKSVWQAHRRYTAAVVALRLLRALVPVAVLWVGKLIIDAVQAAITTGAADWERIGWLVAIEFGIVTIDELASRASTLVESLLGDLFSNRVSVLLMEHAATLDIEHFEDPEFYDQLQRARRQTVGRIGLFSQILGSTQSVVTIITLAGALLAFSPWLFALLVAAVLPAFFGEMHYASLSYSLLYQWTPERRALDYYRYLGASDASAKEVKLFGLSNFLVGRYAGLADDFYKANKRLSTRRAVVGSGLSIFSTLSYYGAYIYVIFLTVANTITLGSLTFLAGAFKRTRDLVQRLLFTLADIHEQALFLSDLYGFLEMRPKLTAPREPLSFPRPIRVGFEFCNVSFRYPNSEHWALRHINFRLGPGQRIALVGENGAGKTTFVKLMARLYDPSEGRILLDGHDLREYDPGDLRQAIGVIFQDFVRYDMKLHENIAVGRVEILERRDGARLIRSAAERSLASQVAEQLPNAYEQMLGRRFEGGLQLSIGQWQKVALARAYVRNAEVLILDEPTAALDARAEYEVFRRFSDLTAGKVAVLISHRFSTVRMADYILVLHEGKLVEHGSHEALLAERGRYAELFELQAVGYR